MSKIIKVRRPDGKTKIYEGRFDKNSRIITTWTGKKVFPGANDSIEVGPCFVATAVYGNQDALQVQTLRTFRDTVLLPSGRLGVGLIALYNLIGPYASRLLRYVPWLAIMMRPMLDFVARAVQPSIEPENMKAIRASRTNHST